MMAMPATLEGFNHPFFPNIGIPLLGFREDGTPKYVMTASTADNKAKVMIHGSQIVNLYQSIHLLLNILLVQRELKRHLKTAIIVRFLSAFD